MGGLSNLQCKTLVIVRLKQQQDAVDSGQPAALREEKPHSYVSTQPPSMVIANQRMGSHSEHSRLPANRHGFDLCRSADASAAGTVLIDDQGYLPSMDNQLPIPASAVVSPGPDPHDLEV
ncbi:hypothetical protein Dda_4228 [Drechslerella dactyloides]|uniref:Uncharacterized protein n=1 Tax=Drechslerella dactyloides TaxID=74499 RepID=A0AAD6IZC9_DREDA|nr:hypothetical protein Dda_4228 [Drechslerella dactyloides]